MNIGVYRLFWIGVSGFLGYNPSSGITGSKGSSVFSFSSCTSWSTFIKRNLPISVIWSRLNIVQTIYTLLRKRIRGWFFLRIYQSPSSFQRCSMSIFIILFWNHGFKYIFESHYSYYPYWCSDCPTINQWKPVQIDSCLRHDLSSFW